MSENKEHHRDSIENVFKEASSPKIHNKTKYQAFRSDEEDSSEADEVDLSLRSRRKFKKERSNTFKVKMKSIKGKKKEKEKRKKTKSKSGDEALADEQPIHDPIFGVPLDVAVERSKLPDNIELPRIVRDCIQFIEDKGLSEEGIYRISGVKSKVDQLKLLYNEGRVVNLDDYDPNTISSLLKLYLRELPSNVLTTRLAPIFDACVGLDDPNEQVSRFQQLINDLPCSNKTLLGWLFIHFSHVTEKNSETKMNIQNLSIVFSPTMSISHGVLNIFFTHTKILFPVAEIIRYVPPEEPDDEEEPIFPDGIEGLQEMLLQNESVLSDLHDRVNQGNKQDESLMDELWERQRRSTQIKRRIKALKKVEKQKDEKQDAMETETEKVVFETVVKQNEKEVSLAVTKKKKNASTKCWTAEIVKEAPPEKTPVQDEFVHDAVFVDQSDEDDEELKMLLLEEQRLLIEHEELMKVNKKIKQKIQLEQQDVNRLQERIREYRENKERHSSASSSSSSSRSSFSSSEDEQDSDSEENNIIELELLLSELENENKQLQLEGSELISKITKERNVCVDLQTEIRLIELKLAAR